MSPVELVVTIGSGPFGLIDWSAWAVQLFARARTAAQRRGAWSLVVAAIAKSRVHGIRRWVVLLALAATSACTDKTGDQLLLVVQADKLPGYIDHTGRIVIRPQFIWANDFWRGSPTVMSVVTTFQSIRLEPSFPSALPFPADWSLGPKGRRSALWTSTDD